VGLTVSNLGTSGLDVASIVSSLMSIASVPQTQLAAQQTSVVAQQGAWTTIQSQLAALQTAASAINTQQTATGAVASVSNPSAITATATSGASAGTVSMTVDQLATAAQLASGGFDSANSLVGAGMFSFAAGLGTLGLSNLNASAATAGAHTVTVTQASAGAQISGSAVTIPVSITSANGSFTLGSGNGSQTVTVAPGTYSSLTALAAAVQQAVGSAVTVGTNGGGLTLSTTAEGSSQSLTVGANSALGFAGGTAQGTDAIVSIDGTSTTLSTLDGTGQVSANGITLDVGTHLSLGSSAITSVQTSATTTLAGLAAAITAAGGPATASVIDTGAGSASAHLILGATNTGLIGDLSVSATGMSGFGAADLQTLTAASNAVVHIGSLEVTRSSNTISDIIPGVTLQLTAASATPVTVTTGPNASGTATNVNNMVSALNSVLSTISTDSAYNTSTSTGGPLFGDGSAQAVTSALQNAIVGSATSTISADLNKIGLHVDSSGTYSIDSATLTAALSSDPVGTAKAIADIAGALSNVTTSLTQVNGIVPTAISTYGAEDTSLQSEIDDWQTRLEAMQTAYTNQYAALSATVSELNSQGSTLASAIAGLPTWSSSNSSSS
jgi:flagellar hook-associated protein 2